MANSSFATDYYDLAGHWSPVVFQDTATKDSNISQDFITHFNFDGNYNAYDNWENQPNVSNPGYIYFSVVESQTHYYIIYSFFHPRDWEQICTGLFTECHENDGEQIRLIIAKDGSAYGTLQVMETQAHGSVSSHKPSGSPVTGGKKSLDTDVSYENGSHPRIYVEAHGHGPFPCDSRCADFPGGDGVVYRFKGKAEVPSSANDSDVAYDLIDELADLWLRRHDAGNGNPFDKAVQYSGVRLGAIGKPIGKDFGGDTYGGGGHPGWGWGGKDGVNSGDWLIDAAYVAQLWYTIPNENDPGFLTYTFNRYLDDLKAESSTGGGGGGGGDTGGGGCTMVAASDGTGSLALLLLSLGFVAFRRHLS
ncbi:MAG: hypothetical protein HYT87_08585 [Nitrospirae bacterium]|nr:hypothetical protein [Nitrospirota bacterium]